MALDNPPNTIDRAIVELAALFRAELSDVQFPGVDADTLDDSMAAVTNQLDEVYRLRRAHQEALDILGERERVLRDHARKAQAYAKVYAIGNTELCEKLNAIALDPVATAPKKRRPRKRKKATEPAPQLALEGGEPAPKLVATEAA